LVRWLIYVKKLKKYYSRTTVRQSWFFADSYK